MTHKRRLKRENSWFSLIRKKMLGLLGVLLTQMAIASPQIDTTYDRSQLSDSCLDFIDKKMAAQKLRGGFVSVPEDYQDPKSKKIQVFYYHHESVDFTAARPVVFINGGPNSSYQKRAVAMNELFYKRTSPNDQGLVMFDQRGVGCSSPLNSENVVYDFSEVKKYTSRAIAQDMEGIKKVLSPDNKWRIFGFSYGGIVTNRYLNMFPNSVESVDLYAGGLFDSMSDFFKYRILAQRKLFPLFMKSVGNKIDFDEVFRKIAEHGSKYCTYKVDKEKVCGRPLLDSILASFGHGHVNSNGALNSRSEKIVGHLQVFLNSNPDDDGDPNKVAFEEKAAATLKWFSNRRAHLVSSIWAHEVPSTGNPFNDCAKA